MRINTVTIIGANGTQGSNMSGIFASFGKAKVYMISRTVEKSQAAIARAIKSVRADVIKNNLVPLSYEDLSTCIPQSDLVLECVAENLVIKQEVYALIAPFLAEKTIVASLTSGLSINQMAELFTEPTRSNYLGLHFFNPPYNMPLCEVIPSKYTDSQLLTEVEQYLRETLFRTVVRIKDAPGFLANRIGFQFINESIQFAEQYRSRGGIDYIDAILSAFTGRNMPPIETADFVGLDVHKSIVDNLRANTNDYANETFIMPPFAEQLIADGKLGRKTRQGFYKLLVREDGSKQKLVYDIESQEYRPVAQYSFPFAQEIIRNLQVGDYQAAMAVFGSDNSEEAIICRSFLTKYALYSIATAHEVAEDVHAADHVMAEGFNWIPPLALVDALGGAEKLTKIADEYGSTANVKRFLLDLPRSTYDYRKFFKAKL